MAKPTSPFFTFDFSGELDGVPTEPPPTGATRLENAYKFRRKLVRRKGQSQIGSTLTPDQDLQMLEWFKIGSTEYLLSVHNTNIINWFSAFPPGTIVNNGTARLTGGTDCNAAWVDGKVYVGNGTSQNVRFNGARVDQVMFAAPLTAPTAAIGAATGITGTFTYKVVFLSADGAESEASPASNSVTVSNQKVNLTAIPTCPEPDCAGRRIYRTKNGGAVYFRVADISDNTTATYTDTTADASLVIELVEGNTRMPPVQHLSEHQSRLIGSGNTTDPGTLFISNVLEPWYCPLSPDLDDPNQGIRMELQGPAAGTITGHHSHAGVLAAFTGSAGFLLLGDEPSNFRLQKFCDNGCTAHRTIVSARNWLFWLAPDGVYRWTYGSQPERISDDQRTTIEAMTAAEMAQANAFVWDDRYFLCWPTGCIVFDIQYNIWTTNTNWLWRDTAVTQYVASARQRLYGARYGHAAVDQLETGATDNGTAIPFRWVSRDHDFGLAGREKRLHWLYTYWKKGTGTATVVLKRGTGATVQTLTHDISTVDDASEEVSRQEEGTVEGARSEFFRIDISISSTASEVELLGAGCMWTVAG